MKELINLIRLFKNRILFIVVLLSVSAKGAPFPGEGTDLALYSSDNKKIIMLDAGSSGVRAIGYKFKRFYGSSYFDLVGQSDLVEGPALTASTDLTPAISKKLLFMKSESESDGQYSEISYFVGGTAGLRTLDTCSDCGSSAKEKLTSVVDELLPKGIALEYGHNVRLLSGLEEAAFTWLAVNYVFRGWDTRKQYGIIELGGGSVQLAYGIKLNADNPAYVRQGEGYTLVGESVYRFERGIDPDLEVYGRSYLGFGLNRAYEKYLALVGIENNPPCLNRKYDESGHETVSKACFEAVNKLFDGIQEFIPAGPRDSSMEEVPEVFFLNGYFYDRTSALGLPNRLTPKILAKAADYVCSMSDEVLRFRLRGHARKPFFHRFLQAEQLQAPAREVFDASGSPRKVDAGRLCAELSYISALLGRMGLKDEQTLFTKKSLDYHGQPYGISWPLGYAVAKANDWLAKDSHGFDGEKVSTLLQDFIKTSLKAGIPLSKE